MTGLILRVAVAVAACRSGVDSGASSPPGADQTGPVTYVADMFVMGADLSYVNQIVDHGGEYGDSAGVRSPWAIFAAHGANTVRLRLWHTPSWVRTEVYDDPSLADARLWTRRGDS